MPKTQERRSGCRKNGRAIEPLPKKSEESMKDCRKMSVPTVRLPHYDCSCLFFKYLSKLAASCFTGSANFWATTPMFKNLNRQGEARQKMLCKMSWSDLRSCKQCVPRCLDERKPQRRNGRAPEGLTVFARDPRPLNYSSFFPWGWMVC